MKVSLINFLLLHTKQYRLLYIMEWCFCRHERSMVMSFPQIPCQLCRSHREHMHSLLLSQWYIQWQWYVVRIFTNSRGWDPFNTYDKSIYSVSLNFIQWHVLLHLWHVLLHLFLSLGMFTEMNQNLSTYVDENIKWSEFFAESVDSYVQCASDFALEESFLDHWNNFIEKSGNS